jgi:hypothetical protein
MNRRRAASDSLACFCATFGGVHDVDLPAGQVGRQAHVLAATANGDGQVFLVHHHVHGVLFLVHHDGGHVGRCQRTNHELRRVFGPQHDVHTLASQFVGHGVHAGATHADAGADGVHALVVRQHGNLGARTGVTGAALDLQQALLDLGHFLAEQLDHELGGRARQDDGSAAQRQVHFHDHGAHTVATAQVFLRDHLASDAGGLPRGRIRQ